MKTSIIVDTGPLVAFLNRSDKYHKWMQLQVERFSPPFYTCEAVISEASFLLRNLHNTQTALFELLHRGLVIISFELKNEIMLVKHLMNKYHKVPMSFADACLVRMIETKPESKILTIDSDFNIYRKHGRQVIETISPD